MWIKFSLNCSLICKQSITLYFLKVVCIIRPKVARCDDGIFNLTGSILMKNNTYLKLKRPIEPYNQIFSYQIYLDDQPIANLKNGEEVIIKVPETDEPICLYAKFQWCRSRKIPINELNTHKPILVRGDRFLHHDIPLFASLFPIFGIGIIVSSNSILQLISLCLIAFLVLFILGALLIKRNNWIKLEE
jgi:hypothetical protein